MAVIETWFNQDLQKIVKVHYVDGSMFSHNGNGNRVGVRVYNNGEPVTLSGTVSGYVVLSDGTTVPCTGARSGNEASILIPAAAYQPGKIFITVFLTDGTTVTTLASVVSSVLIARTGTQVDPGSVVTDWTQTINGAMQDVQTATANLGAIVATPYASLTFPVPLGKYTYYNNNLYRCTTPIATSEAFTPANWSSAINIGDELQSEIANRESADSELKSAFEWTSAKEIDNTSTWESGSLKASNADEIDSDTRIRMDASVRITDDIIGIKAKTGYDFLVYAWTLPNTYIGCMKTGGGFDKTTSNYLWIKEFVLKEGYKYKIVMRNADDPTATMTTAEGSNCMLVVRRIDDTLMEEQQAADAKAVGDAISAITGNTNSMIYYQALTTTDDLDTLTRSGLYAWGSSNVPQNCPVNAGCKLLCMYVNSVNITQIIVPSDNYFVRWRYKMSTGWNEWEPIPDRTYIDNEIVRIDRLISDSFVDKYNPVSITGESGYYWNRETDTAVKTAISSYTAYAPVSVQAGEKYSAYIYSASSSKQRPVLLVDDNYLIKQSYLGTKNAYNTFSIIIPNSVTKILLCTDSSHASATKLNKVTVQSECDAGLFNFKNANIAIIGDSISTNGDYSASNLLGNVPEIVIKDEDVGVELSAYATYYDIGTTVGGHEIVSSDVGTEITFTPTVGDVGKLVGKPKNNNAASVVTWWEVAQAVLGFNPIPVCWSGSSITSHEGTDNEYKTSYAWHPAQIRKCGIRTPGTMTRTAPDMVIIYRGTNDFSHSPYSKLTADYFDSYPWTYPNTDAVTGGYGYKEGLCLTIRKLREAYPMAKIVLCTCNFFKRVNYSSYPINNGEYTENQLNNAIREVANYMGCGLIEFDKDGLTYENASSTYYQDSAAFTHPTTAGHRILGTKALRDLMSQNNMN